MKFLILFWRKMTQSRALEQSGPYESMFFESVYRLSFITGLSTSDPELYYTVYSNFIRLISTVLVYLEVWRLFGDNLSLDDFISSINVVIIHFLTMWKLMTMVKNKEVYKKLAKTMETSYFDVSTEKRETIVHHWADTHRKYLKVLMILSICTLTVWYTFPLIDEVEYNLMIDLHVPMDYSSPLRYAVTYTVIGIVFNSASFLVIMSEVIMQAHLLPLICQYAVLADCFENVFEDVAVNFPDIINHYELTKNKLFVEKYLTRLGKLVDQHRLILNHTTDLKRILSAPMLGQLGASGMLICFVGYQATATIAANPGKFVMSFLYLSYNMFTLYLICRWCEEITLQSHRIGEAAYFSGWEGGMSTAPGVRATIMLVIVRANKPLVFLAGGMYTLNLSSYTNLVKASYSALNILLRMSHE